MSEKHMMIDEIISEQAERMYSLAKYYPFFALYENTFAQYKEGKYQHLDMGYITLASLRFFINENNFNEKPLSFAEYEQFLLTLLRRDFDLKEEKDEEHALCVYIFDKLKNDGKAFTFSFYDPQQKRRLISRVKLFESTISDGNVFYHITADAIEFYLATKEIRDESKINIEQLLLEKMITSNNFKGGIEVVRRINSEVIRLKLEKEEVIRLLDIDVYEGAQACRRFMEKTAKWFSEEQKLFAKNKALLEKAIVKAQNEVGGSKIVQSQALKDISNLSDELKKTIYHHGELITETTELARTSDEIIRRAKLKKLRPVFDFGGQLSRLFKEDRPQDMAVVLAPLFAPKIEKSFQMASIDRILTLKTEDRLKGEVIEKGALDLAYQYGDELLDIQTSQNFYMLFIEVLERLMKWKKITVQELEAILEIKFGEEVLINRDYYAFLTHLAGKQSYRIQEMLEKPDTMLEGMIVQHFTDYDISRYGTIGFILRYEGTDTEYVEYGEEDVVEHNIHMENEMEQSIAETGRYMTGLTLILTEGGI